MNFRDLNDLISSGVEKFVLNEDVLPDESERLTCRTGISLDIDNLIIDGAGHNINGCGLDLFRVFGGDITLKNINFVNAKIVTSPTAKLNVTDCSFKGVGGSPGHLGGTIFSTGDAHITNSIFKNCELSAEGSFGGAISNHGRMSLEMCEFTQNSAPSGGAIFNGTTMEVRACLFKSNTAAHGGAIMNRKKLQVHVSSFKANRNPLCNSGEIHVSESLFEENTQSAISNYCDAEITASSFIANTGLHGAAINNSIKSNRSNGDAIIDRCNFSKNSAVHGGAISNRYVVRLKACEFDSNTSKLGGAIYSSTPYANYLGVVDCSFTSNEAEEKGGAIITHGDLEARNSIFKRNSSENGGAIYNSHERRFDLKNCTYEDNSPDDVFCSYGHDAR